MDRESTVGKEEEQIMGRSKDLGTKRKKRTRLRVNYDAAVSVLDVEYFLDKVC